jgi:hypothetical protein
VFSFDEAKHVCSVVDKKLLFRIRIQIPGSAFDFFNEKYIWTADYRKIEKYLILKNLYISDPDCL